MIIERRQYPSLDIAKFAMAILILMQHTCNEWAYSTGIVHAILGLGNFAVPFFFSCSGFLFFTKYDNLSVIGKTEYYKKWSIRIAKMYLVWSSIYFVFVFISWFNNGFEWIKPFNWFHRSIVFSTYATIWFLPALWLGVTICRWIKKLYSLRTQFIIIISLMFVGNMFGSYSNIITSWTPLKIFYDWYMDVFITWRNGVFNGAPYVYIGYLIAKKRTKNLSINCCISYACLFSAAFIGEAFCIIHFNLGSATDMGFMMAPATFFIMATLIKCHLNNREIWKHFRNLSMLIFLGQRLFLSAIPGILPSMTIWILSLSKPVIFLYFICVTLIFSIIIERLSVKYKLLKILW